MKLKVNIPMLAESEMELRVLATRMRAIADEVYAVRSSLLSFGETFRHEASLTGRKQDKLIEEMLQMRMLANALENVLDLYSSCERQQEMDAEITNAAIRTDLLRRSGSDRSYHSTEQVTAAYEELIKPLLGVL
jgi:hypothetical protein